MLFVQFGYVLVYSLSETNFFKTNEFYFKIEDEIDCWLVQCVQQKDFSS